MSRPSPTHFLTILLTSAIILLLAACAPAEFEPAADSENVTGSSGTIAVTRPDKESLEGATPTPVPPPTLSSQSATATAAMALTLEAEGLPLSGPEASPTPIPPPTLSSQSAAATAAMAATFEAEGRPLPGANATPTPVPPFPGLVYRNTEGLWQAAADWQPVKLFDRPDVVLAPDGQRAISQRDSDLWLVHRGTGEEQDLTGGLNRTLCCVQWWPARSDVILFGSWDAYDEPGPNVGKLTAVTLDGEVFTLEEETASYALPDPSADGQTIAYDRAGQPALYHWDEGAEPLAPADYGLPAELSLASPAWSPDGNLLAWATAGNLEGTWQAAIAVLDVETQTARLLHPYVPVGRGGWFEPPAWSPDGRWLAFTAEDQNADAYGVWVVSADGSEEHYLGQGRAPIWSPDGRWLVYSTSAGTRLVEVESWYQIQMYLPGEGQPVDWLPVAE